MPYTIAFYERTNIVIAIGFRSQGSTVSNWYDMEAFHRATVVLTTGVVQANSSVRAMIFAATDAQGTNRTLVKQMTVAQAVNGNDDLAIIELRTEEMQNALQKAKFIRVECVAVTTGGSPYYCVHLLRREPRYAPVDVTHIDRLIA